MKTKTLLFSMLLTSGIATKAQITPPPFQIPDSIPQYDGSYEATGQNHLFYPNAGEIRFNNIHQTDAYEVVKYYTMNTHPKKFLLHNNNLSFVYAKPKPNVMEMDSLHRIDIEWQRSNSNAFLARVDTQHYAKLNYITQWFGATGRTDVEGGAAIACQNIYNNIDLVYTSNNAGIVMYFIVYPGGNYNDITMHLNGAKATSIAGNKVLVEANWESSTFEKPKMYQYVINNNVVTPVTVCPAFWQSIGGDSYRVGTNTPYNTNLPLVIQIKQAPQVTTNTPRLCWSTYFGGNQYEFMTKTHTDANDNLYIAGSSNASSNTFPQNPNVSQINAQSNDGAITKFNSSGVIQWSTFIGGSANENIRDFDVSANSVFCVGRTSSSTNFPITPKTGAHNDGVFGGTEPWDGFIYEFGFNPSTGLFTPKWSTYFGGNGWDDLYGCKLDGSGNFYIVGASSSSDMGVYSLPGGYSKNFNPLQLNPSTPISTDGIIAKFNNLGAIQFFTFYGTDSLGYKSHTHAADYFYGLTLSGNNIYVCGKAGGLNLRGALNKKFVAGNFDGILTKFSTNGALLASKFTNGNIANYAVKELWGEVYTVGVADTVLKPFNSGNWYYNGTASGNSDGCFSIHTQNLDTSAVHNSYLGGNDDDGAYDLQFTTNNLLLISGGTKSSNFPVTSLGLMYNSGFAGGLNDNFITCLQQYNTNLVWSSNLGSNANESMDMPPFINSAYEMANTTISVDSQNRLRLLGSTTSFNTFPLNDGGGVPYYQSTSGGAGNDASITCFDMADITAIVGLKDFANTKFVFGLYPNPTNKVLSITNQAIANSDLTFAIYDINGKKLKTGVLNAKEVKDIDVSHLQQGIYIINVSNGKTTYSNKFIKSQD